MLVLLILITFDYYLFVFIIKMFVSGLNFMPVGKNDTLFFDYSVGKGNEDTFLGYTSNLTNFLSGRISNYVQ